MKRLGDYKDFRLSPLNGLLDLRSSPGEVGFGNYRIVLNMAMAEQGKPCRLGGWKRLFADSEFGFWNQDLHDQLIDCQRYFDEYETTYYDPGDAYNAASSYDLTYCGTSYNTRPGCREAMTLLFEASQEDAGRTLLAASKSRIYALVESAGNWELLADGLGGEHEPDTDCSTCNSRRFSAARLGAVTVFTNDYDPVLSWTYDASISGCNQWRAQYIDDLLYLNITKAKVVSSWKGFVFIANVEQNGFRYPSRIFWSDFNAPNSWIPDGGNTSLASSSDFGFGESVLAIEPLGGQLRIYTDKAIYEGILVNDARIFSFQEIYRGPDVLQYRYSLVNTGKAHIYIGATGIFALEEYNRAPIRVEWMHKASGAIFNGVTANDLTGFDDMLPFGPVNREACDQVVGFYDSERKLVWFSWPTDAHGCPNVSLILNLNYNFASIVDKGFTAGLTYHPDPRPTMMDFLREHQVCNFSDFAEDMVKVGIPINSTDEEFDDPPTSLINETEDPDAGIDQNSFCAKLGNLHIEDICDKDCRTSPILILADADDFTLKEYDPDIFCRENYIDSGETYDCPYTVTGVYDSVGYATMLQGDAEKFTKTEEKLINKIGIDFIARAQTTPNLLHCQVGYGAQPSCLTWANSEPVEMKCLTERSVPEHKHDGSRPAATPKFNFHQAGIFLAWRFFVLNTGGGACFNEVKLSVRMKSGCW